MSATFYVLLCLLLITFGVFVSLCKKLFALVLVFALYFFFLFLSFFGGSCVCGFVCFSCVCFAFYLIVIHLLLTWFFSIIIIIFALICFLF